MSDRLHVVLIMTFVAACGAAQPATDAGGDAGDRLDAGPVDSGTVGPPAFVDLAWRVRCPAAAGGCTDGPDRAISDFAGTCTNDPVTLAISDPAGFGIDLDGESVRVREAGVTFVGAVSPSGPCTLANVVRAIDPDTMRPVLRGELLCRAMGRVDDPTDVRDLTGPGATGAALPVVFALYDCR